MADEKISAMPLNATPGTDALVPVVTDPGGTPTNEHTTIADLVAYAGGGGGLVLLEQHTASTSASLDFTSFISASYDEYQIEIVQLTPATDAVSLYMKVSTDGGSTWVGGTAYTSQAYGQDTANGVGGAVLASAAQFRLGDTTTLSNVSTASYNATLKLYGLNQATKYLQYHGDHYGAYSDSKSRRQWIGGTWLSATAVNALQFLMSSGNIASGTIRIYGLEK